MQIQWVQIKISIFLLQDQEQDKIRLSLALLTNHYLMQNRKQSLSYLSMKLRSHGLMCWSAQPTVLEKWPIRSNRDANQCPICAARAELDAKSSCCIEISNELITLARPMHTHNGQQMADAVAYNWINFICEYNGRGSLRVVGRPGHR